MTLTDLKLNTVDGVTALIQRIAKSTKPETNPLMVNAIEAVVNIIDRHSGFDAGVDRALDTVRKAYGFKAQVKPSQTARDLNAAREAEQADQAEQIEQISQPTKGAT